MRLRYVLLSVILMLGGVAIVDNATAQDAQSIYKITFRSRAFGTARSVGMGGAFTSLGADISSLNINPAGLGMYRSSEVVLTPSIFSSNITSNSYMNETILSNKDKKNSFILNNVGAVFSLGNNLTGAVKGINVAFSYNIDNYNKYYSNSISKSINDYSILDYFRNQLNSVDGGKGVNPKDISSSLGNGLDVYHNAEPNIWGAMMAYNTGLLGYNSKSSGGWEYTMPYLQNGDWTNPNQIKEEKVLANNFSFGAGIDISNFLYLGMTMGVRSYESNFRSTYYEEGLIENKGSFQSMEYVQHNNISGSSFDFKIGATLEPLDGLKIGIAYHAPTVSYITDEIYFDMYSSYGGTTRNAETPYNIVEYKAVSASRFLSGISYRIGKIGILSFDYERVWNNNIEIRDLNGIEGINSDIKNMYRPSNNLYFGAEIQPIRNFFLRGGYSKYESPYTKVYEQSVNEYLKFKGSDYNKTSDWSIGVGFRAGNFLLDFAYINSTYTSMPYEYYGDTFIVKNNQGEVEHRQVYSPSVVEQKIRNSQAMLTLGFKF